MAKRVRPEKLINKMKESTSPAAQKPEAETERWERRRASLPQPDFTYYKKYHAYPGKEYLFVGHSYNVEGNVAGKVAGNVQSKRSAAIAGLFTHNKGSQWVGVKAAFDNKNFYEMLSRFERDWLQRLPETALVGPAVDEKGNMIPQSFTVWRKEMRKQAVSKGNSEKTLAGKQS